MNITINHQITFSTEVAEFLSTLFGQQKTVTSALPDIAVVKSDITVEQVRARASEVTKAGKKEEAKALLNTFGAGSVTALSEEHYADFLAKLNEL